MNAITNKTATAAIVIPITAPLESDPIGTLVGSSVGGDTVMVLVIVIVGRGAEVVRAGTVLKIVNENEKASNPSLLRKSA